MILTTHHLLFLSIARDGLLLEHIDAKRWWSLRAIDAFKPETITPVKNLEAVRRNLAMSRIIMRSDTPDWDALYAPRANASIGAVEMGLRKGLPLFNASFNFDAAARDGVIDWLNMLSSQNDPMLAKLHKVSWRQAVGHAQTWRLAVERQNVQIAGSEDTVEVLYLGKWSWFRLETMEAVRREGFAMSNCLVEGAYDDIPHIQKLLPNSGLFSLRDRKGRSVVTALFHSGELVDAYERENRPVREHLQKAVDALGRLVLEGAGPEHDSDS